MKDHISTHLVCATNELSPTKCERCYKSRRVNEHGVNALVCFDENCPIYKRVLQKSLFEGVLGDER